MWHDLLCVWLLRLAVPQFWVISCIFDKDSPIPQACELRIYFTFSTFILLTSISRHLQKWPLLRPPERVSKSSVDMARTRIGTQKYATQICRMCEECAGRQTCAKDDSGKEGKTTRERDRLAGIVVGNK